MEKGNGSLGFCNYFSMTNNDKPEKYFDFKMTSHMQEIPRKNEFTYEPVPSDVVANYQFEMNLLEQEPTEHEFSYGERSSPHK